MAARPSYSAESPRRLVIVGLVIYALFVLMVLVGGAGREPGLLCEDPCTVPAEEVLR